MIKSLILKRVLAISLFALLATWSGAAVISVNLAEDDVNQGFAGGINIGPLGTDSSNWNSTIDRDSGSLASGSITDLIDDAGASTGASITWNSIETWTNGAGTADDEHKLNAGYLGDGVTTIDNQVRGGSVGAELIISDIPYTSYRVYGLLASGDGDNYPARNFQISDDQSNYSYVWGSGDRNTAADAYGNIDAADSATGNYWVEIEQGVTRGNYWTYDVIDASSSTLVVNGIDNWNGRGSIGGLIVEEAIPEPMTILLLAVFGFAFLVRRFCLSPRAVWRR